MDSEEYFDYYVAVHRAAGIFESNLAFHAAGLNAEDPRVHRYKLARSAVMLRDVTDMLLAKLPAEVVDAAQKGLDEQKAKIRKDLGRIIDEALKERKNDVGEEG